MALAVAPVQAAAILLPVLVAQDAVGVWAFRRDWDAAVLRRTLPGAAAGVLLAWLLAASVPVAGVLAAVGTVAILFGLYRQYRRLRPIGQPRPLPGWSGTVLGLISGFASQIAHAGGPPFQVYALSHRLAPTRFAGTIAIFFAITNVLKLPAYGALGQFTPANLGATVVLLPLAILSTWGGVRLVRRVAADRFYHIVDLLLIAVGVRLLWSALG